VKRAMKHEFNNTVTVANIHQTHINADESPNAPGHLELTVSGRGCRSGCCEAGPAWMVWGQSRRTTVPQQRTH